MDRRTALASAGAVAVVVLTGSVAMAASFGLLGDRSAEPAGQLQPGDPELTTVVVEPDPVDAQSPLSGPAGILDDSDGQVRSDDSPDDSGDGPDDSDGRVRSDDSSDDSGDGPDDSDGRVRSDDDDHDDDHDDDDDDDDDEYEGRDDDD